ncbi:hypothetical protein C8A05DRAFT_44309 [Staphylotrichum tortipilum]|uniref:Uncharacterized protein n=1 Tax=Staphylotrichum tortipilum TaxID=2831512 RepID=A0AAN6RU58_9PEZI|nr:hypothetical protein C8A05DRAFT_44309 [Staphylotrichum longicolle]
MPVVVGLPSESFWPAGIDSEASVPFPKLSSDPSSSLISPLTLPRGVSGYFDQTPSHRAYSPLSPGARGPALHPGSVFSPRALPTSAKGKQLQLEHQQRSSSLPPKTRNAVMSPTTRAESGLRSHLEPAVGLALGGSSTVADESNRFTSFIPADHPRSLSADPASPTSHAQMVQRVIQQNARLREAWEAERKYLEANRERAEEVYKEERALMEVERAEWDAERAALMQEVARLRQALARSAGSPLGSTVVGSHSNGVSPASNSLSPQGGSQRNGGRSLPTAAPINPDLTSPRSPNGPTEAKPDFLRPTDAPEAGTDPVPIVDVGEIHPELEGIPIKATSVKKATFTGGGSRGGSPTSHSSGTSPERSKSPRSKEQTLEVLAARASDRLVMHAGHTPNHSLSSLATAASSGTITASSNSGSSTPTMLHGDGSSSQGTAAADEQDHANFFPIITDRHGRVLTERPEHPQPIYDALDDPELKGPLMVRNMPAHDEMFFRKLSDKLAEVSKDGEAALPAVLKDAGAEGPAESAAESSSGAVTKDSAQPQAGAQAAGSSSDSSGSGSGSSRSGSRSNDEEFLDVPLKFKKRMNFGAPFGEIRF